MVNHLNGRDLSKCGSVSFKNMVSKLSNAGRQVSHPYHGGNHMGVKDCQEILIIVRNNKLLHILSKPRVKTSLSVYMKTTHNGKAQLQSRMPIKALSRSMVAEKPRKTFKGSHVVTTKPEFLWKFCVVQRTWDVRPPSMVNVSSRKAKWSPIWIFEYCLF